MGQPIWLCKQFVNRPCIVTLIGAAIIILCMFISISNNLFEEDADGTRMWLVWDDIKVYNWDKQNAAIDSLTSKRLDK